MALVRVDRSFQRTGLSALPLLAPAAVRRAASIGAGATARGARGGKTGLATVAPPPLSETARRTISTCMRTRTRSAATPGRATARPRQRAVTSKPRARARGERQRRARRERAASRDNRAASFRRRPSSTTAGIPLQRPRLLRDDAGRRALVRAGKRLFAPAAARRDPRHRAASSFSSAREVASASDDGTPSAPRRSRRATDEKPRPFG